jgi:hypothetical protein
MKMAGKQYPVGVDCVWLALDQEGHVAAFATGGSGPMPLHLLEAQGQVVENIEARLGELSRTAVARLLVSLKRPDDFVDIAERGIFAYDWSDVHRAERDEIHAYELIAAPSEPIKITALPDDVARLAAKTKLGNVTFGIEATLDVRQSVGCVEGD